MASVDLNFFFIREDKIIVPFILYLLQDEWREVEFRVYKKIVSVLLTLTMVGCSQTNDLDRASNDAKERVEPFADTKEVSLYIEDKSFITIRVPEYMNYVTDYSKYICEYSDDSTVAVYVSVLSNVEMKNFTTMAGLQNPVSESKYILLSENEKEEIQEAALYLPDCEKAIVLRSYVNPVTFETIYASMKTAQLFDYEYIEFQLSGGFAFTDAIPDYKMDKSKYVIEANIKDNIQSYALSDGSLVLTKEMKKYEDACTIAQQKVMVSSKLTSPTVYYKGTDKMYAEIGDYTIGVQTVNYNTSVIAIGVGMEARNNISVFMG